MLDLHSGLMRWRLWMTLGYFDFVTAFRRTLLGPLWQIATVSAWIGGLWLVFGGERGSSTLLYIGLGVINWGLLQSIITSMPNVLRINSALIMNVPNPISLYIFRKIAEQCLRWVIQLLIAPVLMIAFAVPLVPEILLILPNLLIVLTVLTGAAFGLAAIGTRIPALRFAMDAVMRLMFFMTPIFWTPGDNPLRTLIATWNPFSYLLELLRLPLMGQAPSAETYGLTIAMAVVSMTCGLALFSYCRNRMLSWI
jgi:lipopolysaccharide transport system permease protein